MDDEEDVTDAAERLVEAALDGDPESMKALMESGALDDDDVETGDSAETPAQRPVCIETMVKGEDQRTFAARAMLNPSMHAALSNNRLLGSGPGVEGAQFDLAGIAAVLEEQVDAANGKDLKRGIGMLVAQAHTLDNLFNYLVRKGTSSEYLGQFETYMKLAIRTQSNARATWEAISAIQNPPVAGYVKQANIAQNQQINNGSSVTNVSRARENEIERNELMESSPHEQWMDQRTPQTTERADKDMEAVGKIDRTENGKRQSQIVEKRAQGGYQTATQENRENSQGSEP